MCTDFVKFFIIYNNYSMSSSWIWSDKITNEHAARIGYNHFISNKGKWNNCFSKFSNRVLPPIFISAIIEGWTSCGKVLNLAQYFPYDVKLRLLAHSRSFSANQKARNAIVGAENLLIVLANQKARNAIVGAENLLIVLANQKARNAMVGAENLLIVWN